MTFVRVRLENGREVSLSKGFVEGVTGVTVLDDQPATNLRGQALPESLKDGRRRKPKTSVNKAAAKKAAVADNAGGVAAERSEEGTE